MRPAEAERKVLESVLNYSKRTFCAFDVTNVV